METQGAKVVWPSPSTHARVGTMEHTACVRPTLGLVREPVRLHCAAKVHRVSRGRPKGVVPRAATVRFFVPACFQPPAKPQTLLLAAFSTLTCIFHPCVTAQCG